MNLSAKQIKPARAMLDWSPAELAAMSDVSEANIVRLEAGGDARSDTLKKIGSAFETHGVVFTPTGGIEPARPELRTYAGRDGFQRFFDDVYMTVKDLGGEIVITGVVDQQFVDAVDAEFSEMHPQRMRKLKNFHMRCLTQEGDTSTLTNEYCEYRWTPRSQFAPVPFYVYGNKVAFIQFDAPVDAPLVVAIHSKVISDAFRLQFDGMWKLAKEITQ